MAQGRYGLRRVRAARPVLRVRRIPTRVFISFDYDQDRGVAALLGGQLRRSGSPFVVENWSMKEAAPQRLWRDEARRRINRSDVVLVVVGRRTHRAEGVLAEVAMARAARPPVPIRQIVGYRTLVSPRRVPSAGRLYRWGQDNLTAVLAVPRRRAL